MNFEKKMRFNASDLKYMAGQSSHSDIINQRAELALHILDCHAEIDRLNGELTAYNICELHKELAAIRSQLPAEREWIGSETHETFPERGVWFWWNKSTDEVGARDACAGDYLSPLCDYTLILAKKDFPVPPKPQPEPLEVKVGKYQDKDGNVLEVISATRGYVTYLIGDSSFVNTVNDFIEILKHEKARFIGGGDDAD